jgi:DNA polymerase-3 subunit delta
LKYYLDLLDSLKRGNIAPVYLFYGPEVYLREQALARFKEILLEPATAEFNLDLLDGEGTGPDAIVAAAGLPPLLAARRLVIVRQAGLFRPARAGAGESGERPGEALLRSYLEQPAAETCLVFDAGEAVDKRRKIYKLVAAKGRVVEFSLLKPTEIYRWLEQRARQEGRGIQREASEEMLRRRGKSLISLYQEMEKLINYTAPGTTITPREVRDLVPEKLEDSIFAVVDAIGEKQCARALQGIRDLLLCRVQPHYILAMVVRQFRLILLAGELRREGCSGPELAARLGAHPFVAKKVQEQGRNFTTAQLLELLDSLGEIDVKTKTGRLDFYPAMEMLVLKLCQSQESGVRSQESE